MICQALFVDVVERVSFFRKVFLATAKSSYRFPAKKSVINRAHSISHTPPTTSGTWPTWGSRGMSQIEPHAPNLASHAPNTIRPTCVCRHAPAHIGHGSKVTINVQSARFHVPSDRAACVMALTSACANGSACASRRLRPRPITAPPASSTTAPTGTSPSAAASRANSIASPMSSLHCISATIRFHSREAKGKTRP